MELDLRIASQEGDADDHRLDCAVHRLGEEVDVVRPHERLAERLRVADERHHELARRVVVELAWAAGLLEAPVVDHGDLVGDLHRLVLVVSHEDRRHVHHVVEPAEPFAQLRADTGVECAERLVEEEHLRLGRERAGQAHPLALAAGELGGIAMPEVLELDEVQELVDAFGDLRLRPLAHLQPEGDVVAHRHVLEGRVVLEDETDVALLRRHGGRVLAAEEDRALVGGLESGDDPQEGRLARAARPEEGRERARLGIEGDVVERDEVAEPLRDVANENRHQAVPSLGRITVMATSTRMAMSASTIEMAYAPARSKAS